MHISPFKFENLANNPTGDQFTAMQFPMKPVNTNAKLQQRKPAEPDAAKEKEEIAEHEAEDIKSYTEEELEAAKLEAFKKGFEDGRKEAQAAIDQDKQQLQEAIEATLQSMQEQLPAIEKAQAALIQRKQEEIGKLVLHCSGRLTLEALRQNPASDVEVMIGETLEALLGKYEVHASVHPRLVNALTERFGKQVRIKPDPAMTPGDCTLRWESGEAVRRIDDIWSDIEHVIDRYFVRHKTDEQSDEDDLYLTPPPSSRHVQEVASDDETIKEAEPDGESPLTDTHLVGS